MNHRSSSGQILVLVLLIVLVALTIGLSIASRTLSNLKNTAELDQSNRAFSAAEAGIERALRLLQSNPQACTASGPACEPNIVDNEKVTAIDIGGTTDAFGISSLDKDDVVQVNVDGYSGTAMDLYWGSAGDNGDCTNLAAAVVVSVVYVNGGNYGMGKVALDPCPGVGRGDTNGFTDDPSLITANPALPPTFQTQDGSAINYGFKYQLNLSAGGPLVSAGSRPLLIRTRLMYNGPKPIAFNPLGGAVLPNQGKQITSTAESGGKQRTVTVLKTNSALPAIFDYALFNGSTSTLTK